MLLVLFIMFISSLLWLLVMQYTKDMITISWLFTKYYRTYFYAYWWLELWLAQINYRSKNDTNNQNPFWYEDTATFSDYTECSPSGCSFDMSIESRWSVITDSSDSYATCTDVLNGWEPYSIEVWDWFIIPLFYDTSTGFSVVDYEVITNTWAAPVSWEFENLDPELYNQYAAGWSSGGYIIKILDEDVLNYNVFVEPEIDSSTPFALSNTWLVPYFWSESPENKNYLIVANATWSTKEFCLQLDWSWPWWGVAELPLKYMTVSSAATYKDITVAFGAVKTNELPSYLIYGTINP